MSDIIDLSKLRKSDDEADLNALTEEDRKRLEEMAEKDASESTDRVITAFVVYQKPDGSWITSNDLNDATKIRADRPAVGDDMVAAAAVITKDITSMTSAEAVVGLMQMQMAAMQQQAQQQAIMNRLQADSSLRRR